MSMFKTRRRKQLERKEDELWRLKHEIRELKAWCAADSGEIAFAMLQLENPYSQSVSQFRDGLRKGKYTFEEFKKIV
jgi:hypothetical protein